MNILEQRSKNKIKIKVLKEKLEKETGKKVNLQEASTRGFNNEKVVKQAVQKLVSKQMTAGEALLLAQKINDSVYLLEDLDLASMLGKYKLDYMEPGDGFTGGIEQLLQKIGYVLSAGDVNTIKDAGELGRILVKLFYSGEAQKFISDEFIKAVAAKVAKDKRVAKEVVISFTGGDPLDVESDIEWKEARRRGLIKRATPLLTALKKQGLAN